jgi:menaquinone-specific isochorismate synthase
MEFGSAWIRRSDETTAIRVQARGAKPPAQTCAFFAPDFALNDAEPWMWGQRVPLKLTREEFPELVHSAGPSSADFARMHEEIQRRIGQGEFEKVVPIVCEELEFAAPLKKEMFAPAIMEPRPHQLSYGFEFGGEGMCGVTPEILFTVRGARLETMALAGTGAAGGPSLLSDPKERHEHGIVIEHIAGELREWGTPDIGITTERVYGSLMHLHTPITLNLNEPPDFMKLIVKLHPTAALGGWPRRPAVEWLEQQDFHTGRRRFGAPFGYMNGDEMLCVVAIRCLQWWGSKGLLSAGCGVVRESVTLREWNELQLKRRAICSVLGLSL